MMNEKFSKYIDPVKNFWNKQTKNTRKVILFVLAGIVVLAVVLSLLMNQTKYVVLYPGLDHDEAVEVMTELSSEGVSYKEDGGTIYVPSDQENSLRMQLANEGHPETAPNYDFFTGHINAMTTDYEEKVIEKYQMNQRLEAVIKTLDPIEAAYVTISIPDDTGYVLDDNKSTATASVTVKVKEGETLSTKQVSGVKRLVSTSVPNITTDNVAVIDASSGEELSGSDGDDDSSGSSQMDLTEFKLKVEKQYEDSIKEKVLNILEPQYGEGNVSISVTSKMDLDKKIQDIVTYQPTTSDNKGIISKSDEDTETTTTASEAGGAAGTEDNTDTSSGTTTYPGVTVNGNTVTTKDSKTYEYFVSQIEEQIQSDAGSLDDLTVSVLINTASMTDKQKQSIADSVAVAAGGLEAEKVNVRNGAFATSGEVPVSTEPAAAAFPTKEMIVGGCAGLLLIILLIVLLAIRNHKKKKELMQRLALSESKYAPEGGENPENGGIEPNPFPENPGESIATIRNSMDEKERKVKQDLQEFSKQNPEIVAQLVRSWLRGDDHNA